MSPRLCHTTAFPAACLAALVLLAAPLSPGAALADAIGGFVELDYSNTVTKTTDPTGMTTKTKFNDFTQKYYLTLNKTVYPNLKLDGGGIFEKSLSTTKTETFKTKTSDRKINLFGNLVLATPIYNAGLGYNRREERLATQGSATTTLVNEDYNILLGWRPQDLPTLDVRLTRTNNYDVTRELQDLTTDVALVSLRYIPVKQLDLRYSFTFTNPKDKLNKTDTEDFLHTARLIYSDVFFKKRTSLYFSYDFSRRETTTTTSGAGEVSFQVFPQNGLSLVETFPATPDKDTLSINPALIDGNKDVSAGINIGFNPSLAGDTNFRDLGLEFPNSETEINTLQVWVDKTLTPAVSGAFSWSVFISDDNVNWSPGPLVSSVTFGPFEKRFEIRFLSGVKSRFVKVVTKPLPVGVTTLPDFADIFVTELQPFLIVPASEVKGTKTTTTNIFNLSTKTRILDVPHLYHDLSLFLTYAEPSGLVTYFLTNGISLDHRLSRVLAVNARVAREDSEQTRGHQGSFVYSASATATPYRTLSHSLIYSGRRDTRPTGNSDTNSFTLFNKVEVYRGINLLASLGYNFGRQETGQDTTGTLVNVGASFVPHRTLTLNVIYIYNKTTLSGGGKPDSSTTNDRVEVSVSYNPVRALYIFGSVSQTTTDSLVKTLTNYGLNFSPFPDGALQFNFAYNERLASGTEGKTRLITPTLRWNIRSGAYLDVSYTISQTRSPIERTDSNFFNASLKVTI